MAIGSGVRAGKAFVEFVLDDKRFKKELHALRGALFKVGSLGTAATAPLIAGFTAAAASFANAGSELHDMSKQMGIPVEMLSEMKFAAEQSGASLTDLTQAARQLQKKGIDPRQFFAIADSIAAIPDPVQRAQAAMEKFGARKGTSLLSMLDDLPELRKQFRELGIGMSTQNAAAADALGDSFGAVKAQAAAMMQQIGAAVAGPLTEFLTWSQGVLTWTIEFIKQNPELVKAIAAITGGIAAASIAALALSAALTLLSANPIVLIAGAIAGIGIYAASKFGAFDNMMNIPKMAPAMAPRSGVGTAAGRQSATQSGDGLRYLRRISTSNDKLVNLYQRQGLIAGNG